ncbi:MAG: hypothetical protein LC750_10090 [Actinobacteria bacterium]|nr:hypothetical protein [Actinomycetota bacterium]
MNHDQLTAIARGVVSVIAGAAILAALIRWLGWWTVAVLAGEVVLDLLPWPLRRSR